MRESGILLHPTSLPGPGGIGSLGEEARRFIDFLQAAGQRLWQVLPLGPTGLGNSPYQCSSAFAGNPLLIDVADLIARGHLPESARDELSNTEHDHVDFAAVIASKGPLLRRAFEGFKHNASDDERARFAAFREAESDWLDEDSLFSAICQQNGGKLWLEWPQPLALRHPQALNEARQKLADEIEAVCYEQFIFFEQWDRLKTYANQRGVKIIGDVPIFVALNSSDVWARPELFLLGDDGQPLVVAGVPPDYFSDTGQLWGNPLYNWDALAAENYDWWVHRIRVALRMSDLLRIDHFRGFESYWEIPAGDETAINGRWIPGPGRAVFDRLREALGDLPIIAEDLGIITDEVRKLRDDLGLPGMKILHFAFGGDTHNAYLPHNIHDTNCLIYPGTHDNDTTRGWFDKTPPEERTNVQRYLSVSGDDISWDLIRAAWHSRADRAITMAQDLLSLDTHSRLNTPGTLDNNWTWRLRRDQLTQGVAQYLRQITSETDRLG